MEVPVKDPEDNVSTATQPQVLNSAYATERIYEVLPRINTSWFLPSLQREFVWGAEKICDFFDSLMRSYPISSFLLWRVPESDREDLEVYRFIESGSDAGKHNVRDRVFGVKDLTFVLDGQQRLTSLLIGFKGTYEFVAHRNVRDVRRLHLDILRNGEVADEQEETRYGFDFRMNSATTTRGSYWFELGRMLRHEKTLEALVQETLGRLKAFHPSDAELSIAKRNLERLHAAVFSDLTIPHHTETHGDQERMLDIFVRANSGGVPLSKPDLLLSNLTVHWKSLDAREEIKSFVDNCNASLNLGVDRARVVLKQDFVLKSCLVLLDSPVAYRISTFNKQTCQRIADYWTDVKQAIMETVQAANWFGVNGLNLTSANALIPIAYYLYRNPSVHLRSDERTDAENASLIRRWLTMALMNGIFGGSSDSMLHKARAVLMKHGENGRLFPVKELDAATRDARRLPTTDENAIKKMLDLEYGDGATVLALTLLYDERAWGTIAHHCDHIFPQSLFRHEMKEYRPLCNSISNLMLLGARENSEKNSKPFDEWIESREPRFLERQLIPTDKSLWAKRSFPEFLQERGRLMLDRFFEVLGRGSASAINPSP